LAGVVANVNKKDLAALEQEVVEQWQDFKENGNLIYRQRLVVASARK
jgi:hypothetical protein